MLNFFSLCRALRLARLRCCFGCVLFCCLSVFNSLPFYSWCTFKKRGFLTLILFFTLFIFLRFLMSFFIFLTCWSVKFCLNKLRFTFSIEHIITDYYHMITMAKLTWSFSHHHLTLAHDHANITLLIDINNTKKQS